MEEWRTVIVNGEIYNNYMVSNLGNVKSLGNNKSRKEKLLKPIKDKGNYLLVNLCKDGKRKTCKVHRLVAEVFIPKIEGKEFVDHIDGNRQNNVYTNLRWCTHKENCNFELCKKHHSESLKGEKNYLHGKTGVLHHSSKQVLCVELNKIYGSAHEAEREMGIKHQSISAYCNGKQKSAGKHPVTGEKLHWKYIELLPCYNEEVINRC